MKNDKRYLDQDSTTEEAAPIIELKTSLCGLPVYWNDRDERIGHITDALVSVEYGWLSGLLFRGQSGQKYLARQQAFLLAEKKVYVSSEEVEVEPNWQLPGVPAQRSLHDALVLTNEGYVLGRICRVYLHQPELRVTYCVARNWWERRRGQGFYLPGQVVLGFSHVSGIKPRLVTPFNTMERFACATLEEAFNAGRGHHHEGYRQEFKR